MAEVRVAVVGVGNCCTSLVEGISLYRDQRDAGQTAGLITADIGGYQVSDLTIVAAFDVATDKVGQDLADAIQAAPNDTIRLSPVPRLGVTVLRGPTLDGISDTCRPLIKESGQAPVDVAAALRDAAADVVVSYLPVGSDEAAYCYAAAAIEAGCAYINCMPTQIASAPEWQSKFRRARLPVIGDDIKSQLGATILHRAVMQLLRDRGVAVSRSYQLNIGGNTDFLNMHQPERGLAKEGSKTRALEGMLSGPRPDPWLTTSVGYVPALGDRKTAYIRVEGGTFGLAPVNLDIKLEVWDSPNSAGVVADAIRYARLALDRGMSGPVDAACAYLMKSPPAQLKETEAIQRLADLTAGSAR